MNEILVYFPHLYLPFGNYKLDSLMWAMKVSVSISFISHLLYCRSVYVRNYKQAHWNDFSVYHLILFGLNIGGRVGHKGEGIARKADVETLHCGRGLWEEIRWSRYRQSCGRSSAENYTLATGSWRSCWSDRWDIMQGWKRFSENYFVKICVKIFVATYKFRFDLSLASKMITGSRIWWIWGLVLSPLALGSHH